MSGLGSPSKLVLIRMALSETKCLFWLFRFERECFAVSIELKQTKEQTKQFGKEDILVFFQKILGFGLFQVVLICFETVTFGCFAPILNQRVLIFQLDRNKQKTNQNSFCFSENFGLFRFVSVCFETVLFVSKVSI